MNRQHQRARTRPPPQRVTWTELARGIGALTVLVVLVAGIPWALLQFGQLDLPASGWSGIGDTLTSRDDGTLFLAGLTLAGWIGWAAFAIPVLVEIPAHLAGRAAPALPGFAGPQRLAAELVTAIAVLGAAGTVLTAAPPAHAAPPAATATGTVSAGAAAATATPTPNPAPVAEAAPMVDRAPPAEVTVQPGDTLRGLAAVHLGDETQWPALYEANRAIIGSDPDLIRPGQQLQLPATGANSTEQASVTVQAGDTLRRLAGTHLGDETEWPALYEANRAVIGTDPDLIRPGQVLDIPEPTPAPAPTPAAAATPRPPAPAPAPENAAPPPSAVPTSSPASTSTPTPEAEEPTPTAAAADTAPATTPQDDLEDTGALVRLAPFGLAGLLLAGTLTHLRRRRHRQAQECDRGQRIPKPPPGLARAELAMRSRADVEHATLLRAALRALTTAAGGQMLPPVLACHLTETALDVLFAAAAPTPAAFYGQPDERVWRLDEAGRTELEAQPERPDVADPLPGLVTVGRTDPSHDSAHGGYLLLNLEALGVTTYAGPADDVTDLLTTAVLELATSPWGGWFDLRVVGVGFGADLHPLDRISRANRVDDVLPDLVTHVDMVTAALAADGLPDAANGRLRDADYDAYTLTVVVTNTAPTIATLTELTELAGPHGGLAVLMPSPDTEGDLEVTPHGRLRIDALGIEVTPQRLTAEEYQLIGELFASTAAPPVAVDAAETADRNHLPVLDEVIIPTGAGANDEDVGGLIPGKVLTGPGTTTVEAEQAVAAATVGDDERAVDEQTSSTAGDLRNPPPVEVRILGPVDVHGAGQALTYPHATELVLLLALRGEAGADGETIRGALGENADSPLKADYRRKIVNSTRSLLGKAADATPRLSKVEQGIYRLHPEVGMDWTRFQRLVASGTAAGPTDHDDLRHALTLVRGKPLDGAYFWWIDEPLIDSVRADVVDAAEQLAELDLAAGDPQAAAAACRVGMRADPGNERLCRLLMQALHADGDTAGTHRVFNALVKELRDLDPLADPHPKTLTAYRELTRTG